MNNTPLADPRPAFDTTVCPHCLNEVIHWLPAQPLFPLEMAAAALLIRKKGQMYTLLWRHKDILDPPRYAHGPHGRRYRLLTAREIRLLRDKIRLTQARVERFFWCHRL
jgi:hypothetical protein